MCDLVIRWMTMIFFLFRTLCVDLHFFLLHPLKLHHTLPLPSATALTAADRSVFLEQMEEHNHGKIFDNDHEVLSFVRYRMAST